MDIAREVILDLLPLYLAGEASPATRTLVEEYLKQDPELERRVRADTAAGLGRAAPAALAPEIELRSLRRTRRLLGLQRWLFGLGFTFTSVSLSAQLNFHGARLTDAHFLMMDQPALFGTSLAIGAACFAAYFLLRRRLRTGGPPAVPRRSS
jgi:anti-sigma factor RsiW